VEVAKSQVGHEPEALVVIPYDILYEQIVAEEMLGDVRVTDRSIYDGVREIVRLVGIGCSEYTLVLELIAHAEFLGSVDQLKERRNGRPTRGELSTGALQIPTLIEIGAGGRSVELIKAPADAPLEAY
jgi:hypothetical protein